MSRRNLLGFVLASAIGALGGWVFFILALPLPWMLGSMLFTAVAAIGGAPVALALPIRNGFITILGLMLGSSFTADLLTQLDQWASGMVLMIVSVTLMTIFSVQLFRRFGHFDHSQGPVHAAQITHVRLDNINNAVLYHCLPIGQHAILFAAGDV